MISCWRAIRSSKNFEGRPVLLFWAERKNRPAREPPDRAAVFARTRSFDLDCNRAALAEDLDGWNFWRAADQQ